MRYFIAIYAFLVLTAVVLLGFRGTSFEKPPLWIFPDMDYQPRYKPQGENTFWGDGRDDRVPPAGAVARGNALEQERVFDVAYGYRRAENPVLFTGKTPAGDWQAGFPTAINAEIMTTGEEKYQIFCQVCHGRTGDGNGITKQYGMTTTASLLSNRLIGMDEGEIFNTITYGKGTMGPYGDKLTPEERWAVIAYVRALQLASQASIEDVPASERNRLQ